MKVKGFYQTDTYPRRMIVETEQGELKLVLTTPARELTENDFWPDKVDPNCKKQEAMSIMYKWYGLEKASEQ